MIRPRFVAGHCFALTVAALALVGCGGDSTAPETLTSLRFSTQPTSVAAGQTFSVSVDLLNQNGARMSSSGQTVTLAIAGGTSTLSGTTTATANAGTATFANVSVNGLASNLTLVATSGAVTATSTAFSVHAGAASAQTSTVTPAVNPIGLNANTPVTFTFKDSLGNPIAGATVSAASTTAGATFTPATGTTDAGGSFTSTFHASAVGPAALSVTVNGAAIALPSLNVIDPCATTKALTLGATVTGTIALNSCGVATSTGHDIYLYTLPAQTLATISVTSTDIPLGLLPLLPNAPGATVWQANQTSPGTLSRTIIARAGQYLLFTGASAANRFGNYTLTSTLNPTLSGCNTIYATVGVTGTFSTSTTGCTTTPQGQTSGTFYSVPFNMNMVVPATLSVHVTSTQFTPLVEIRNGAGTVLASSAGQAASTIDLSTPVPAGSAYIVVVTSATAGQTGTFSITIDP